jgi:hypothetical protein
VYSFHAWTGSACKKSAAFLTARMNAAILVGLFLTNSSFAM